MSVLTLYFFADPGVLFLQVANQPPLSCPNNSSALLLLTHPPTHPASSVYTPVGLVKWPHPATEQLLSLFFFFFCSSLIVKTRFQKTRPRVYLPHIENTCARGQTLAVHSRVTWLRTCSEFVTGVKP